MEAGIGDGFLVVAARVVASMSPDDTATARRVLKVLEECGRIQSAEATEWRCPMPRSPESVEADGAIRRWGTLSRARRTA